MMREILFRGKRFSNGEWVVGGIMKTFHPNYDCENEEDFFSQLPNCYCICANNKDYFVEQDSIGQYTGLTDKNGVRVFEGDVVKMFYKDGVEIGVIAWSDIHLRYKFTSPDGTAYGFDVTDTFEVIGNIHDSPELLGGEKE